MGGALNTFAFWAYPKDVAEVCEQQGWYPHALSIDVGKGALPEEETKHSQLDCPAYLEEKA